MTKVHCLGPNLRSRDGATFHVHAEGCADVKRSPVYRGFEHEHDRRETYDVATLRELVQDIYVDQIYSDHAGEDPDKLADDYSHDFKVFPCVTGLPATPKEG